MRQKSAGLRTNILIAVGSALFTLMSIELAAGHGRSGAHRGADRHRHRLSRRRRDHAHRRRRAGLTTAATVWVNAAVGVAAGGGEYHLAFIATGVTLAALLVLRADRSARSRADSASPTESGSPDSVAGGLLLAAGLSAASAAAPAAAPGRPASIHAAVIIDADAGDRVARAAAPESAAPSRRTS